MGRAPLEGLPDRGANPGGVGEGWSTGSLRQDLLQAARAAVQEDLLRRPPFAEHPRRYGVVLGGSAATEDADEYSGCDLFVFRLAGQEGGGLGALRWETVRRPGQPYRYAVLSLQAFVAAAARGEDAALHLVRHGAILHDPGGRLERAWAEAWAAARQLWPRKLAQRYRAFRQRRASLAWSLRRGQPLQVMDNLLQLLEHALSCAYYLEGQPAPPRKWLFRGGLRTSAGRALREPVLGLLSSLGDLATLGGSLSLRHNRIYRQVDRVQRALEAVLHEAGYPVPGLAAWAAAPEDGAAFPQDGQGWQPRVRPVRRARTAAAQALEAAGGGAEARHTAGPRV
jgi:hypothetical protein